MLRIRPAGYYLANMTNFSTESPDLNSSPSDQRIAAALQAAGGKAALEVTSRDLNAAWARVESRAGTGTAPDSSAEWLSSKRSDTATAQFRTRKSRRPAWYVPVFAGIIAALGIGWWSTRSSTLPETSGRLVDSQYITANNQQATVSLPDGSEVLLNVASRLVVPRDFGVHTRTVQLTGQARFVVVNQSGAPFVVTSRGVSTQVLGTSFSVRSYTADSVVVAVESGRVQLNNAVAGANQIVRTAVGREAVVGDVNVGAELAFVKKELVFAATPLADVVPMVNRWYDIELQLGDPSLEQVLLTAQFAGAEVSSFVIALETVLNVRAVRRGRVIILYPETGRER